MPIRSRTSSTRRRITWRRDGQLLHAVGELLLDGVGDEACQRVLPDHADRLRELARRVVGGDPARRRARALDVAAGEVRHQPVDDAQQRRLA